jgi:hypothetical protein
VTTYSTNGALRAFQETVGYPSGVDCKGDALNASFKHGTRREVASSEECPVGQPARRGDMAWEWSVLWEEGSGGGRSATFGILWDAISINVVASPVVVTVELVCCLERSTCKLRRVFQFFSF